ncbi:bifunctional helix-turn-helix transcriptional regulator/GNAT family N-acetyltransferase [Dyadobacter sp. Leaf189]|uniref:bifunctional helix-turn-helix transcriptional regulator/GNAT family N-acetyltransferase n=1 Tax=Dyadobacter sp. Leaf189 TaxID=1736295 RepID=UPI0006FB97A3|nr:bifunctional helix-turn-helix transcriptional regulator/GNAT family N-acetyltransferase [Dyadobacter sp. Leaf189]KQS27992.1 MarR family transcriptional regulator [Dyadobacter sp. Leaf189]
MNIFKRTGKMALGSRLRMLTAKFTDDASSIYNLYHIDMQPKWFPVFYVLSERDDVTITDIAAEIGHSQPSVSKIVREMATKGLVIEKKDAADGRRNVVQLSAMGREIIEKIQYQYEDVNNAVEELSAQANHDLWKAIEEWEFLLEQKSLFQRVREQRKLRESSAVEIVPYEPKYQSAFRDLNVEWISAYFKMEEADYRSLDHPQTYILDRGGSILVALYKGEPVGVCALIKMDDPDYDFELAKMAVSPKAQGLNIGWKLGNAAIEKAKSLGANALYLESNTILKPAISLYHKLGFKKVTGRPTPYERANIQMELRFDTTGLPS